MSYGLTVDDRKAVFDVLCIDQAGRRFVIELQHIGQENFRDRSLYYSTFPIQVQAMKGKWDYKLQETITIGILGFKLDNTDPGELIHRIRLIDEKSGKVFNPSLAYVYIETPKFRKGEEELESRLDQWLYVLNGMNGFKEIPVFLREDEIFKSFFMTAEAGNLAREQYLEYIAEQKNKWDWYAIEQGRKMREAEAEAQGIKQGIEKGIEQGREEGILIVAKAMKTNGVSIDIITKSTGLSEDQINDL